MVCLRSQAFVLISLWLNFHGCSKCFRTDVGKAELDTLAERSRAKWENMSTKDKVADFAARHQFSLIGTSWAASMIGAYAWISRDPYELFVSPSVMDLTYAFAFD